MPDLPISQLPELTAITQNAEFTVAQNGTTYRVKNSVLAPFPTVYGLYTQTGTSNTVSATTVETTLINGGVGTLTVSANTFNIGDSFKAEMGGVFSAANNDTIRIRVKAGPVILLDSGPQTLTTINNDVWVLSMNFSVRQIGATGVASIVSLGVFQFTKTNNAAVNGFSFNTVNNTTFDTTINNTLNITVEWGSNSASNKIYSDIFVLDKIY
jgi:hypothetical protein